MSFKATPLITVAKEPTAPEKHKLLQEKTGGYAMKYAFKLFSISVVALSAAIMIVGVASATSATLRVTNDGADSATCGAPTKPCRSISQAIENASDGDSIEVGAGHYGNVSGDSNFAGPGDEHPQPDSRCIVCITKALSIFSLHGAAVTVIESIPSPNSISTVGILHDGVTFGQAGGGFTVTGGNVQGIVLDQNASGGEYGIALQHTVTIAGNVDLGDAYGFEFNGAGFVDRPCPNPSCISTAQVIFSDNESINNGVSAFSVYVNTYPAQITLQSNLARGAVTGFFVSPGGQDEAGDALGAGNVALVGNVSVHNGVGFFADAPGKMEANTASDNAQAGFLVVPGGGQFKDNSAIGNAGPGAIVQFSTNLGDTQGNHRFQTFTQNNFYGNDRNRPVLNITPGLFSIGLNPGPSAHCGVLNMGAVAAVVGPNAGGTPPTISLAASGNFWGSAHGPAPTGVGDAVGGACDQNGGVTTAKSFATIPFAITSWP
jgi:hypothetical protein